MGNIFNYEKQIFAQLDNVLSGDIARVMAMKNLTTEEKEKCINFINEIKDYLKDYTSNKKIIDETKELNKNMEDDLR